MKAEVVVVGGGPAGALAAQASAAAGARTVLLERAPKRRACCAGLVGPETLARLSPPKELVLRPIREVRVQGPKGLSFVLEASRPKGFVLDRTGLDRWLRERAAEAGVSLLLAEAREVKAQTLSTSAAKIAFEVLIGADGAQSGVARWTSLPRPREILVGGQAEVKVELGPFVEIHLGVVPDFFAWVVPAEEGTSRVGLATKDGRAAPNILRGFLAKRFPYAEVQGFSSGLIPIGPPERTAAERVILLGNAAAQTKPLTGGGLAFMARLAPLAGRLASQGPSAILDYERLWRKEVEEEMAFGLKARAFFLGLEPPALARILAILSHPRLRTLLAEEGDIDHLATLSKKLRRSLLLPHLLPLARFLGKLWPG